MNKKILATGIALVALTAGAGWIWMNTAPPPDVTLLVEPADFQDILPADGQVDAQQYRDVYAPYIGYEKRLIFLIDEGALVKTGDMIAQFDPAPIQQAVDDLEERISNFDQGSTDQRFNGQAQAYEQEVRADMARQQVALTAIRKENTRYESIIRKTTAEVDFNQKKQSAKSETEQKKRFEVREDIREKNRGVSREYLVERLERLKQDMAKLNLYAEQDGVLLRPPIPLAGEVRKVQSGDRLERGQSFLRMPVEDVMIVRYRLEEAQVNQLRQKMEVRFTTAAYPNEVYYGRVLAISSFSDPDLFQQQRKLYEVVVRIEARDKQPPLKIGMVAHSRFLLHSYPKVYALPKEWITREENGVSFTLWDGKRKHDVRLEHPLETADYILTPQIPQAQGAVRLVAPQRKGS